MTTLYKTILYGMVNEFCSLLSKIHFSSKSTGMSKTQLESLVSLSYCLLRLTGIIVTRDHF